MPGWTFCVRRRRADSFAGTRLQQDLPISPHTFPPDEWGLVLGGSSGFGLAASHKLSSHGLDLCIVHRDRRGAMRRIEPEFDRIRERGVRLLTFNTDALDPGNREETLDALASEMGPDGGIRVVLHSIAFGNLKLLGPERGSEGGETDGGDGGPDGSSDAARRLAEALDVDPARLREEADRLFQEGVDGLAGVASPAEYPEGRYIDEEDMARTIHAMGSSLLGWVQEVRSREMFTADARVLSLTSEGSTVAWKGYAAVSAAKAVLEALTRSLALEMAHSGIRSNVIQAGVTDTAALRVIPGSDQLKAGARSRNPFGRLTTPEDVADVIYLLTLPESSWINGAVIRADGGEAISGSAG